VDAHPEIDCTTTDSEGHFTLSDLPRDTELVLVLGKDGYNPSLKPIETSAIDMLGIKPIVMGTRAALASQVASLGVDVDLENSGNFDFFAVGLAPGKTSDIVLLDGATATLSPKRGDGPFYRGKDNVLDPTLEATTSAGGNFFFNVPPGDYEVHFTAPPGYTCAGISYPFGGWGFPVADAPAVRFPIRKGYHTADIAVLCTPTTP
jgi:hypothetical protein